MSRVLIKDIVDIIEKHFPPVWQEDFDNTRLQVGEPLRVCTGVMICVDASPEIVVEAIEKGCNLIVTHHPLIFKPLKHLTEFDRVTRTIYKAIRNDVSIYSCHTSVDNAPVIGVSWKMGSMLGLTDIKALEDRGDDHIGSGIIGTLPQSMSPIEFANHVKATYDSPVARCSNPHNASQIKRVALCGGAGNFLIPDAVKAGADAFIASDCKHNQFIDWLGHIFLVDIGHYESEKCTKQIFYNVIKEKFPNFAVHYSEIEQNPIHYL